MEKIKRIMVLLVGLGALIASGLSCDTNPYKEGRVLYELFCENCHQADGSALRGLVPPLANSDYLRTYNEELPCIIRYGLDEEIVVNGRVYHEVMPPNAIFTPTEIANIINYINNAWGHKGFPYVTYEQVVRKLEECEETN